jgi:glycosyltransferase involved in cell wall biosynthesis
VKKENFMAASKVSIVIPVYNEEQSIEAVLKEVCAVKLDGFEKEIIVSDDGSTDNTPEIVARFLQENPEQQVISYVAPINMGKGAAVRHGLAKATGDIIIIQDADLELSPSEYVHLLKPIVEGKSKVVYGSRFAGKQNKVSFRTRFGNWFLTWLTNILFRGRLTDMETAYKVFRREVLDDIRLRCVRFDFEPEITAKLLRAGHKIVEVPIGYNPRTEEEGKKISWMDGIDAVYTLLRCRFLE